MRKYLAFCLAVLLALAGMAHAELTEEPLAPEENYVLIARLETDGTHSYALLGAGDGAEAFAAFGGEGATYEERIAAFQDAISGLEPAVSTEGGGDVLTFALGLGADGSAVQVDLGSAAVTSLIGKVSFAIVTGSFEASPTVTGDCEVYIWSLGGVLKYTDDAVEGEPMSLCPNCGGIDDGSKEHTESISEFCKEGHTKCMGDPEHYCNPDNGGCGKTYPCSKSNSHTKCIKCGELWCYKKHGDHKELACGHRGCEVYGEEEKHAKCAGCGKYLCNGKNHKPATCGTPGHFKCDGDDHSLAECGIHHICEGGDHSLCPFCMDFYCNGLPHGPAICDFL